MNSYYLVMHQDGGCDYTIGCGTKIEKLRAKTMEEAVKEVVGLPDDWKESEDLDDLYDDDNETLCCFKYENIDQCYILEISEKKDMISSIKKTIKAIEDEKIVKKQNLKEQEEKEQYLKLKVKFEK